MNTHPHVICFLSLFFKSLIKLGEEEKVTNSKNRNTWGRQAQERPRAAVGREQLWDPGGTYNDRGAGPCTNKCSAYPTEHAVTWQEAGILGNRTCGRYLPLSRACLNGITLEDRARPACKDWRGRPVCILKKHHQVILAPSCPPSSSPP